jgi:hypothetical protein
MPLQCSTHQEKTQHQRIQQVVKENFSANMIGAKQLSKGEHPLIMLHTTKPSTMASFKIKKSKKVF